MIEKLEFYHGAALVRLIEDARCEAITKHECGYLVNHSRIIMIKYSTKGHSPWGEIRSPRRPSASTLLSVHRHR